jgi:hypothetical protein
MKHLAYFLLFIIVTVTCACTWHTQLETLDKGSDEVLVGGRITILSDGKKVPEDIKICFNDVELDVQNYKLDSTGYVIMKIPAGDFYIRNIILDISSSFPTPPNSYSGPPTYAFTQDYTNIKIENRNTINYFGDLTVLLGYTGIDVNTPKYNDLLNDVNYNDEELIILLQDNQTQFMEYFMKKYNSDIQCSKVLMPVFRPDSLEYNDLITPIDEFPHYLIFNLTKQRTCEGVIRMVKKKKIYVESTGKYHQKTLFVFKKSDLISVLDKTGNDVTEETLNQSGFKKIHFNRYEVRLL